MPASFNLSTFKNAIHHIGRNQYFEVQIPDIAEFDLITALCRSTSMPPKSHETIDVYYRGLPMKIDGRATFDTWTVTFLSDEGQQLRNAFMTWMEVAYNVSQLENKSHVTYKKDNVLVHKLQSNKKIVSTVNFFGLWPTQVGEVELNQEGGSVETFEVTFTYDFWLMDNEVGKADQVKGIDINTQGNGLAAKSQYDGGALNIKEFGVTDA
jgi:hypothetical protein